MPSSPMRATILDRRRKEPRRGRLLHEKANCWREAKTTVYHYPQTRLMLHFEIQENEYQPEDASLSRQYRPDLGLWIWLRSQYCSFVPYLSRYSRSLMFCSSGRRVWAPSTRRVRFSFRGRASAKFYLLSWSERFLMNALVSNFPLLLLLDALLKLPG